MWKIRNCVRDICPDQMILFRLVSASFFWLTMDLQRGRGLLLFFFRFSFYFLPFTMIFHNQRGRKGGREGQMSRKSRRARVRALSLSWSQPKMCHTLVVGFWQMLRVPKGFLFSFIFGWWLMEVGLERGRIIYSFIIKIISIKVFNIYFYYKNNYYKYIY